MATLLSTSREHLSGSALIVALRAGQPEALADLYDVESGRLLRILQGLLGTRADAEDALHDLFVGLPEAIQRYDARGPLDAWLRKVAVRVALMRLRAARRSRTDDIDTARLPHSRSAADDAAIASDTRRAIQSLDEPVRTVFVLYHVEGFSHREISALLGISTISSRVRLSRAVSRLRTLLEP